MFDPMEAIRMQSEVVRCKLNDGLKNIYKKNKNIKWWEKGRAST